VQPNLEKDLSSAIIVIFPVDVKSQGYDTVDKKQSISRFSINASTNKYDLISTPTRKIMLFRASDCITDKLNASSPTFRGSNYDNKYSYHHSRRFNVEYG
jgi:hypothetical protein